MGYAPAAVVDTPVRVPLPYGLFSVVSLAEVASERWENGVEWEALTCDPASVVVGDCDAPEGFPKQFSGSGGAGEAGAFTVYGTYKCSPIGNTLSHAQDRAAAVLNAREEAAAEGRLWAGIVAGATDVGGTGDPAEALGLLEQWIGTVYGSLGVVHASRASATTLVAHGLIEASGSRMFTGLGTPVVVGAGYSDGSTLAASPGLFGYRSEVFIPTNVPGDLLDRGTNDLHGVAERNYLIGYEPCGTATAALTLGG